MKINIIKPSSALSKAYLKQNVNRIDIDRFKTNLKILFEKAESAEKKGEHEEHFKNIVSRFLIDTWYKNQFEINISKRKDLVIHNGPSSSDTIGTIIEAKKPDNFTEMISAENLNVKAFWELILYYFQEREENNNIEIKHLIANNVYDWFIFDENDFDKLFYRNPKFQKLYRTKIDSGKDNPFFYTEIQKIIAELPEEINCIHFNIKDFQQIAFNDNDADDEQLIDLYKILSPEHLLKIPFANDSNSLNKDFYNELLHVLGLEEIPENGKKLIKRKPEKMREEGSLIENTINFIESRNRSKVATSADVLFSDSLELCITWLNRILFLKLLEGQLFKYHNQNKEFLFLSSETIKNFHELEDLFFKVLAIKPEDRKGTIKEKFKHIPYLNSSLFETSDLEQKYTFLSGLNPDVKLSLYDNSVLRNKDEFRNTKSLNTLQYLFEFLSAYNFSSDESAKIQEDNKTIINASVLGLIFEKINGYKDGSFFTPGFITMYMCRETIRRAVVQKFKELENNEIKTFDDVKTYCLHSFKQTDILRFNRHINSLKICDPAVGSGHFLVSALNEIIAIKSEIGILADSEGMHLRHEVSVDNDELVITNVETNRPFEYTLGEDNKPPKQLQRVQVTLFNEKQNIIENCLFGVDINPKSVLICRLRLWIELLKNAYYRYRKDAPHGASLLELETLPNIDINIKCGNSLISRYELNADIRKALKNSKWTIESYRLAVSTYRNAKNKEEKRQMEQLIEKIKNDFETEVALNDKRFLKLNKSKGELQTLANQTSLYEKTKEEKKEWEKQVKTVTETIESLEKELEDVKNSVIYKNAFEWRFEFPEVLDENGDFIGFDLVIGNPPYGVKFNDSEKVFYKESFSEIHVRTPESFTYFWGQTFLISNDKGFCNFIIPSSFLSQIEFEKARKKILEKYELYLVINLGDEVFDEVATPTCIVGYKKIKNESLSIYANLTDYDRKELKTIFTSPVSLINTSSFLTNDSYSFVYKPYKSILEKCYKHQTLKEVAEDVATGVSPGLGKAFVVDDKIIDKQQLETKIIKNLIIGGEINRFHINSIQNKKLIYCTSNTLISKFPNIEKHLLNYKSKLEQRVETKSGTIPWFVMLRPRRQKLFENPKILIRQTANKIIAAYDDQKWYCLKSGLIIQLPEKTEIKYLYLLALLNSKLFDFLYHDLVNEENRIFPEVKPVQLFKLPIFIASNKNQTKIIKKVEKILALKKENPKANTSTIETEIDNMVYQLYQLTDEEIAIVGGK